MSWLDDLFGQSSGATTPTSGQLTDRQIQWFASKGVNPNVLSPAQLAIAVQAMNTEFAQQDAAAQQLQQQQQAATDKAAADAAAQQQAQAEADARAKALADAQAATVANTPPPPAPAPAPTPVVQSDPIPEPMPPPPAPLPAPPPVSIDPASYIQQAPAVPPPTGPTQDEINQMIQAAVTKALADQKSQYDPQISGLQQQFTDLQTRSATDLQSQQDADAAAAAKAQADAQTAADAAAQANTQRLAGLRSATGTGTDTGIRSYFQARGVDPTQYDQQIKDAVTQALSGLSPTDENPSARVDVSGIASGLYTGDENARRTSMATTLAQMFPDTYANSRVTSDLVKPITGDLQQRQRAQADAIIQNMLTRGVINQTGAAAAKRDLDAQDPIARSRLDAVGNDLISSERGSIGDIIKRANQSASTLKLGGTFDPVAYKQEIDQSFNDFVNSLGTKVAASAPGNLYATGGLGAVAGAAQGAGNTQFNPNALAGVLEQQTNDANTTGTNKPSSSRAVTDFVF